MSRVSAEVPTFLKHHFETPAQQFDSGKLGMWLFLATELLLFGGLFCAYAVYRGNHPEIFIHAHAFLDKSLGAINTVILLTSSLTMAWAVRATQLGERRLALALLALTLAGGLGFLAIKYVEYKSKWEHGLLWARLYSPEHHDSASAQSAPQAAPTPSATQAPPPGGAATERTVLPQPGAGPRGLAGLAGAVENHGPAPANVQVFFSLYFLMTGLHGLHVIAGMGAIACVLRRTARGEFGPRYFTPVDFVGLYWHLVDLIWIFLFPLLYLIH